MKKKTIATFFLATVAILMVLPTLAIPSWAQGPCTYGNCSIGEMLLTGSTEQCQKPAAPRPLYGYPAGGTVTYQDTAITSQNATTYYSEPAPQTVPMVSDSIPPENGDCEQINDQWYVCPGIWETQVVEVIDPDSNTDVWQFYNRGYGGQLVGSAPYSCEKNDNFYGQNFQQVNVMCCPSGATCKTCCCCTPLVFDVKLNGYHTTSPADGVWFDFFGNGQLQKMAWTDPAYGNGWLALPQDGKVSSAKQLFSSIAPQPPCADGATKCFNGWRALAIYDDPQNGGNNNGVIDPGDAIWSSLRIWVDKNQDGVSQPDELYALSELGIEKIDLKYNPKDSYVDAFGNLFKDKGFFWDNLVYPHCAAWDVYLNSAGGQSDLVTPACTD